MKKEKLQVSDPDGGYDEWHDVEATTDREAVHKFLSSREYDEASYEPGQRFYLRVRNGESDRPRKVEVEVVPMHFKVGGR